MLRICRHYIPGLTPVLFLGDLVVVSGSLLLTEASGTWLGAGPHAPRLVFVAGITTFLLYLGDLYNLRLPLGRRELVARLLICQAAAAPLVAVGVDWITVRGADDDTRVGGRNRPHREDHRRTRAGERTAFHDHRIS